MNDLFYWAIILYIIQWWNSREPTLLEVIFVSSAIIINRGWEVAGQVALLHKKIDKIDEEIIVVHFDIMELKNEN